MFGLYSGKQEETVKKTRHLTLEQGEKPTPPRFDLYRRAGSGERVRVSEVVFANSAEEALGKSGWTDAKCVGEVEFINHAATMSPPTPAPKLTLVQHKPLGTHVVHGLVDRPTYCELAGSHRHFEYWEEPLYPTTPPEVIIFRMLQYKGIDWPTFARWTGLTLVQVSALANGSRGWSLTDEDRCALYAWARTLPCANLS